MVAYFNVQRYHYVERAGIRKHLVSQRRYRQFSVDRDVYLTMLQIMTVYPKVFNQ